VGRLLAAGLRVLAISGCCALIHVCISHLSVTTQGVVTQVEAALKIGVKEYMRKVVKTEILAKFTEWRRRFHEIFTAADENADGAVPAVSFVSWRGETLA
jgi:hypothetical protein